MFALAAFLLAVVPGPAVLYIVAQSVHGGRRAGVVSAFGIASGGLVHVLAAVIGLSALLAASAEAFTAVKIVGAGYLVWLGIRTLLSADDRIGGRRPELTLARTYRRGVVVNVLNPKTALFFLAFLPQFVDPHESTPSRCFFCSTGSTSRMYSESGPALSSSSTSCSTTGSGSSATSCTSPMRNAVSASKRSPVTK